MMTDRLHETFRDLRANERASAPAFDTVLTKKRVRRPKRHRIAFVTSALAAATAAFLLWHRPMDDDAAPLTITPLFAPTDVLLAAPGMNLLTDMPSLHESVLNLEDLQ